MPVYRFYFCSLKVVFQQYTNFHLKKWHYFTGYQHAHGVPLMCEIYVNMHCSPVVWNPVHPLFLAAGGNLCWFHQSAPLPAIFKRPPPPPYKISQFTADSVLPQSVRSRGVWISLVAQKDSVSHLYRIHSVMCCRYAISISKQSDNHASQYPTWNSWTHCSVGWPWAVS